MKEGGGFEIRARDSGQGDFSLMALIRVLYKCRGVILTLGVALPILTTVFVLFMPNVYIAKGTILVEVKCAGVGSELFGQLTALTGISSQAASNDISMAILRSRTVGAAVASALNLADRFGVTAATPERRMEQTLIELRGRTDFASPDAVTNHITATNPEPDMAASIVNA